MAKIKRKPFRRNAKPKHARMRYRNAAPPPSRPPRASRPPRSTKADTGNEPLPLGQRFTELGETVLGAALTSFVGANGVKIGLPPWLVATGLGVAGLYVGTRQLDWLRHAGVGAASAAGSQAVLLAFSPAPPAPKVASSTHAPAAPPQTAQLPARKNADLGALPPGMLDAAFERARAELAVGDSFGHEHHHQP